MEETEVKIKVMSDKIEIRISSFETPKQRKTFLQNFKNVELR